MKKMILMATLLGVFGATALYGDAAEKCAQKCIRQGLKPSEDSDSEFGKCQDGCIAKIEGYKPAELIAAIDAANAYIAAKADFLATTQAAKDKRDTVIKEARAVFTQEKDLATEKRDASRDVYHKNWQALRKFSRKNPSLELSDELSRIRNHVKQNKPIE